MKILSKLAILSFILAATLCTAEDILFVAVMTRHGTKDMSDPTFYNITKENQPPKNPGELTGAGRHQLYLLGRQLAYKYTQEIGLTSPQYNPTEIIVRSSGTNRTIESAQSFLAGFYQPGAGPSIGPELVKIAIPGIKVKDFDEVAFKLEDAALPSRMQAIPIHTTNAKNDSVFAPHLVCPAIAILDEKHAGITNDLDSKYETFYTELRNKYKAAVYSCDNVKGLYDSIKSAVGNAIPIEEFSDDDIEKMKDAALDIDLNRFLHSNIKRKLITNGLIKDLSKHLLNAKSQSATTKKYLKMAYFQLDDYHIMALQKVFNLDLKDAVPFASTVICELIKSAENYNIKLFYNGKPIKFGEAEIMGFEEFMDLLNSNSYEDEAAFMEDCLNYEEIDEYDKDTYMIVSGVIYAILFVVWGCSWFLVLFNRKSGRNADGDETLIEYLDADKNVNDLDMKNALAKKRGLGITVETPKLDQDTEGKSGKDK